MAGAYFFVPGEGFGEQLGPGPRSGCGGPSAAAVFPAVWLFSSLILILLLITPVLVLI